MRLSFLVAAALVMAGALPVSAAAPDPTDVALGDGHLKAVLLRPEGAGPFAAVVAMHGCGGLRSRKGGLSAVYRDWGQHLVAAGFAVIFPDSYGARGLGNQCKVRGRTARITRERVADANAARTWLQNQSWVVPGRISLIGWSSGATSTLWAVRPRPSHDRAADFRSAVAFYPGCTRLNATAWSARVPTLVLIGTADDVSSAAVCQQMVAGARGRSAGATVHVYPGAYHDFDHPTRSLEVRTGYASSSDGTGRIRTGTNAAARADALRRVPAWLAR
jgi:dienelactone hydrolase